MSKPKNSIQKRRKDPKRVREVKRIQHANSYKEGFDDGFQLGMQVGMRHAKENSEI